MEAKVLVIEEMQEIATLIRRCLAMAGIRCTLCATGARGLSAVTREKYDALILDVDRPMCDGRALLASLIGAGGMPVIILTEWSSAEILSPWWEMGVHEVIPKPFTLTLLTQCVQSALCRTHR